MRIVIDMQGAQGSNRQRGIGRYTLSLSKAIVRNRGGHEVFLAVNGLFPETIEPIRAEFNGLLSQENIRVWHAPTPVNSLESLNTWRRKSAELVREAFLASLRPDVVLVSSLFEGLSDDAVTSISALSRNLPTATILYDLIPFIYRHPYLENPVVEAWYENKLDHLRRSDLLLAISESSRQEAIRYLGLSEVDVINISTAADPQFQPQSIDRKCEEKTLNHNHLSRPYVMYTGGIDHRKNIEGLIRAYADLPIALRNQHQLAIVCSIQAHDEDRLKDLAKKHGLSKDDVVFTGFVSDADLLTLYNLCKTFVFPSWHEGFGLPVLEAMSCGRAVVGSNTSSIPEVIGRKDALFDPRNEQAITEKLTQVLTNDTFREELEWHSLEQAKKFSWDKTAARAITAFEHLHLEHQRRMAITPPFARRPRLAYVSPLPPERSGISDYSAELLPELSRHYNIDVIVAQESVSDPWINANCTIRDLEWFRSHASHYERVLYHFGNSHYHQHMFALLEEIPGVVVLHDFFLSGIVHHMDHYGLTPNGWAVELYQAHGYKAVWERYHSTDPMDVVWKYPCNAAVLKHALGVIVHSEYSQRLAKHWYAQNEADNWAVIPLLRVPVIERDRTKARRALNLNVEDFVVCSYGLLGLTKLNHRLLEAWLNSDLAKDKNCVLVFVGENHGGDYGQKLLATIRRSGLAKRIHITGWADAETFRHYQVAADIGVQLRTLSRGETSAAVLDCMKYGLPTVVNANGSMVDLPDNAVWKLPDEFSNDQLAKAMETLWQDRSLGKKLAESARETILKQHEPRRCADRYFSSIEQFYRDAADGIYALTQELARIEPPLKDAGNLLSLSESIAKTIPPMITQRQLFLDISELVQRDAHSGIQRVVRSIMKELLINPPSGIRVEPVYATCEQAYRYARRFTSEFLDCPAEVFIDDPIEYQPGDIFLGLDLQPHVVSAQRGFYQELRYHGVQVYFVVYDLLCIQMPNYFVEGAEELHSQWLEVVAEGDGAICISKAVADELRHWMGENGPERVRPFSISWFHLGADIENSRPTLGLPDDAESVLEEISRCPGFLMVGTIEPRKGHAQTLAAFELLWKDGVDANLVIVGKQGWMVEELVEKLRAHPELGKQLFLLEGISDEYLEKIYAASKCLIAASEGEGFGLPLIEAAQHNLPIIAREIPVFREVAGKHAFYFEGSDPSDLAEEIRALLALLHKNKAPLTGGLRWLTWRESAEHLLAEVCK